MKKQDLPETYRGYSTRELLRLWNGGSPLNIPEGTPVEKISAMDCLLRDYKIAPVFWEGSENWSDEELEAKTQELRDLLAGYGIKPERL
ncbi:MAG TPA: hypothetical protein PLI51_05225 [bacterium]|nr:hypothetical protein [bacterium]HPQ66114.1 hypothetical protein [bacterium]